MILQLRLDEELIHAQVSTLWAKALNYNAIVLASDEIAKDPMKVKVFLMAAPGHVKVLIKTVEEAIKILEDPRSEPLRILVLVKNPKDCLYVAKSLGIQNINVANYTEKKTENKKVISKTLSLDAEDECYMKELCALDAMVYSQLLPSQSPIHLKKIWNVE